jgi:hypothetical protein
VKPFCPPRRAATSASRARDRIAAPLTYLDFPRELVHIPRETVERAFDVVRWEAPAAGGHFPALEQPAVPADSVARFLS